MSKEFSRVILITSIMVVIIPLASRPHELGSYLLGVGITALILALLMLLAGTILVLPVASRNWGKAVLLTSGLLLLASLTVCSTAGVF